MASQNPDDLLLLIRCPTCGQRFKVDEELRDRTVECGGCEHRFRIDDLVIVRGKKFYPGERSGRGLKAFQRVPLPVGMASTGVSQVRYGTVPDPVFLEPISPQRIIAGGVGVAGMILMALLLMFGSGRGGALDGMTIGDRLVMAGFSGVMGISMLVYANPRGRLNALGVGLLMTVGVLSVPFFFTAGSSPLEKRMVDAAKGGKLSTVAKVEPEKPVEDPAIVALRSRIGTGPLVSEIERLKKAGDKRQAMGLWLRGLSDRNRFMVRDYVLRVTHADPSSHCYPRDGGDYFLVVTGIGQSMQQLIEVAKVLGQTENVYPEISVVEVRIRNEIFVEGSIDKLSKRDDPDFYELNKRELESIDLIRVKRAVQRLAEAEPKVYRSDISRKLISLLGEDGVDFRGHICSALAVWSEVAGPASEAALGVVEKLVAQNQVVSPEIMTLIVKEKNLRVIPILDELWLKNPMAWEALYADLGPPVEASVLKRFAEATGTMRYSAVRILGRVGGAGSLKVLAGVTADDIELKVLVEQAQKSIRSRLGP